MTTSAGGTDCCVPLWTAILLSAVLVLYLFFDVAYFTRMTFTLVAARYFKSKLCIFQKTSVKSWCFLNDIDTLLYHMNNARYLRELDFARAEFYERTCLYAKIREAGGSAFQGATTIRYRRFIKPSTVFTITSKIVCWDEKTIYMDHEFISADGFVNAVATCRQRVVNCEVSTVINLVHQMICGGGCKAIAPTEMPAEIAAWAQANEISSAKLRKSECTCVPENCQCYPKNAITMVDANGKVNGHVRLTMDQSNNNMPEAKDIPCTLHYV